MLQRQQHQSIIGDDKSRANMSLSPIGSKNPAVNAYQAGQIAISDNLSAKSRSIEGRSNQGRQRGAADAPRNASAERFTIEPRVNYHQQHPANQEPLSHPDRQQQTQNESFERMEKELRRGK